MRSSSGPGLFFFSFLTTDSISLLVIGLFKSLFLVDLILVGCVFLEVCPFPLDDANVCLLTVLAYNPFCFCRINSTVPTFISDVSNLSLFFFFLVHLAKDLLILLIFSKE